MVRSSSIEKDQPQQKREKARQTRIDQNGKKNRNLPAQQNPVGDARQHNAQHETNQPRREKGTHNIEGGSPDAAR
jgi:hypothetical protein